MGKDMPPAKTAADYALDAEEAAARAELALAKIRGVPKEPKPEHETTGWSVLGTVLGFCIAGAALMLTIKLGLYLF